MDYEVAVKELPVLFSAPMVRALLAGRKTQTRRVMKDQPPQLPGLYPDRYNHTAQWAFWLPDGRMTKPQTWPCPYGDKGDRLWVRETWACSKDFDGVPVAGILSPSDTVWWRASVAEDATGMEGAHGKWRPSIFMPRWASRITLEVTEVRVQRVQDISEEDAKAEGLTALTKDGATVKYGIPDRDGLPGTDDDGAPWADWDRDPRKAYARLWDSINGKRPGCAWADNPWAWAISFARLPDEARRATP